MNILYDHQMFSFQKFGGITRYFMDLISNLPPDFQAKLPVEYSENFYYQEQNPMVKKLSSNLPFRIKRRFYYLYNDFVSRKKIHENNYDLFHPTYYSPYFLKQNKRPFVVTVHDMTHEIYKNVFSKFDQTTRYKKELTKAADHIITVSYNTKKDLVNLFNIPDSKVSVIHHGYHHKVCPSSPLFENYILYVGDRKGYKNFNGFIKFVTPLLKKYSDIKVVCTGSPFDKKEIELFKKLGILSRIFQMSATEAELGSLYKYALLFIYPSLYEGFGLPILEAFQYRCPVCLSASSCFPEIAGDAAVYFDPSNQASMLNAIEKIIFDSTYASILIDKGEKRLKNFSIEHMVEQTCRVYKKFQ